MVTDQELQKAYRAFKKKLKLMRLDDESRLGRGNHPSFIQGISPPPGFAPEVWTELVARGKLRRAGSGTYSIKE